MTARRFPRSPTTAMDIPGSSSFPSKVSSSWIELPAWSPARNRAIAVSRISAGARGIWCALRALWYSFVSMSPRIAPHAVMSPSITNRAYGR